MATAMNFSHPGPSLRLWRSPASAGGDECFPTETRTANACYTDAMLADIAAQGFNAIWLHGELRAMAPSRVFAELGAEAAEHLRRLRQLTSTRWATSARRPRSAAAWNWSDACRPEYLRIAHDEIANLEVALPILERDPRFGWHGECHAYLYDAASVRRKLDTLREQAVAGNLNQVVSTATDGNR